MALYCVTVTGVTVSGYVCNFLSLSSDQTDFEIVSLICKRGHPFMTSALRGEGRLENWLILRTSSTDRLREMWTKGGGGIKSPKILQTL